MKWNILYGTGAGDKEIAGTVEQAMEVADKGAAYTQQSYVIKSEDGETWIRHWIPLEYAPEIEEDAESEIISFGNFGYYAAWKELE